MATRTARPLIERYQEKVIRNEDGCWGWNGKTGGRYPTLSIGHTGKVYAHRFAYEAFVGPITDGLWVLHHCDNNQCTRPDHLYLGDQFDNGRDIRERDTLRKEFCRRGHPLSGPDADIYLHERTSPKNGRRYVARQCRACQKGLRNGDFI